ncbi:MAG: polyphosphate polymerase domain-containing protein [Spirochaetota bacterium]
MAAIIRFERKYRLTPAAYINIRNHLSMLTSPDSFSAGERGGYPVRSLYFDTPDLAAYREREEGLFGRIKLRLRVYSVDAAAPQSVRVEIKTRSGALMEKHSSFTTYRNCLHLLERRSWIDRSEPVLAEFERLVRARNARPTLVVEYRREGLVARDGSSVRITFDHGVQSMRATALYPMVGVAVPHRPRSVVLEIKTRGRPLPDWLEPLVRDHSLKLVSNSKYAQGIEATHGVLARRGGGG